VLTSEKTFSAAEESAYDLQSRGRATIVGRTTGGGAHPVDRRRLGGGFSVTVPVARAENPVTKTNWERVGVQPDVDVDAERALDRAWSSALESLPQAETDPERRQALVDLAAQKLAGAAR
jgi:C-terminal processing protease CtpA/Prc